MHYVILMGYKNNLRKQHLSLAIVRGSWGNYKNKQVGVITPTPPTKSERRELLLTCLAGHHLHRPNHKTRLRNHSPAQTVSS